MKNKLIIEPNKTKKVGLLTYHHTTNFGSLLQTFALYKTITEIGYPCEIIDYRNEAVEQRESLLSARISRKSSKKSSVIALPPFALLIV